MDFEGIVGQSSALRQVLNPVETVAPSDSTVLLLGETGTGKELIARAIHDRSRRKERTFVKLNYAAIPSGLLESELFGHERGAFTGAIAQEIGRLELADQGSLFLDEVRDIPFEIQPKLLRALREREFERLGSNRTKKVAFPRTGEIAISVNFTKSTGSFPPFFFCLFNLLRMVCLLHLELLAVRPQRFTRSRRGSWQR
jgi:transcriptional regulator with GAF, ATPase, and Fis domain